MKKHVRIFANLGFWKPCIKSANLTDSQVVDVEAFIAALEIVVPFLGPFISVEVKDLPVKPTITTADIHTQN
jgi:hypothetical protein